MARPGFTALLAYGIGRTATALRHRYPVRTIAGFSQDIDLLLKHFEPVDLPGLYAAAETALAS